MFQPYSKHYLGICLFCIDIYKFIYINLGVTREK